MKKWIFALVASSIMLSGCKTEGNFYYLPFVVGQWVNYQVNDGIAVTDSIKVFQFDTDFTFSNSYGVTQPDGQKIWIENGSMSYQLDNSTITIQTQPGAPVSKFIKLEINYISNIAMECLVVDYQVNGVQQKEKGQLLSFEKSLHTFPSAMVGIWQSPISGSSDVRIWDIKLNGTYDFYIYDPVNKVYKEESIGKSQYKLYGRYIVCIWDKGTPPQKDNQVWLISYLTGASMRWNSTNAAGVTEILQLSLTGKLP